MEIMREPQAVDILQGGSRKEMSFLKENPINLLRGRMISCRMWAVTGGTVLYLAVTSRMGCVD